MTASRKILIATAIFVGGLLLGLLGGYILTTRNYAPDEIISTKVRYVARPAAHIIASNIKPLREVDIDLPRLALRDTVRDTIHHEVVRYMAVDSAAIVADYMKRREYELDFSSDTTGVFKVSAAVERNALVSASATIQPLQREVTTTIARVRKVRPYIGVSAAVYGGTAFQGEVGLLIKEHFLPCASYMRVGKQNFVTIGCGYVF